jgi:hypothetical protein
MKISSGYDPSGDDFQIATVSALFDTDTPDPGASLRRALESLIADAEQSIRNGATLIVISDRGMSPTKAPIPSLLATASVHHGLLNLGLRGEAGLIVESGEPREVMHFCLLCGYGANAINPYMAFESLYELQRQCELPAKMEPIQIADNYIAAIKKGILKTMSKMASRRFAATARPVVQAID